MLDISGMWVHREKAKTFGLEFFQWFCVAFLSLERLLPAPHALGRSIFGASNLTGILGCFDRARQSRRFFNMFGGLVRLVIGLNQLRLRSLKLFFDRRFPRHFGFSLAIHGSNIDPANWLQHLRQILEQRL